MDFGRTNKRDHRICIVVALDVRNAFNSCSWTAIGAALKQKETPWPLMRLVGNYFMNRRIAYETSAGLTSRTVTAGVPQGSILGPTLWNVMYDGVLTLALPASAEVVGFADDIALIATGANTIEATRTANEAILGIQQWMSQHSLSIAPEKTEVLVLSSLRKGMQKTRITIGEGDTAMVRESQPTIRYLGIHLHDHLRWTPHIRLAVEKAGRVSRALRVLLPNHHGAPSDKRRLLANVAMSTIRYGAPLWADGAKLQSNARNLNRVQRRLAQGVASTFRTVSHLVATVLAGMPPICLLVAEDKRRSEQRCPPTESGEHEHPAVIEWNATETPRSAERRQTLAQWQESWDGASSRYASWTRRVIPDLTRWTERNHGNVDFHMSQVLSGHGFFREYLQHKGFATSGNCTWCPEVEQTAEHVLFHCSHFAETRTRLLRDEAGNQIDPDTLLDGLLSSAEAWQRIALACREITGALQHQWREEERERGQADPALEAAQRRRRRANERRRATRATRRGRPQRPQTDLQREGRNLQDRLRKASRRILAPGASSVELAHHEVLTAMKQRQRARANGNNSELDAQEAILAAARERLTVARREHRNERQRRWRARQRGDLSPPSAQRP